jgi:hypothetical protein
VRARSVDPVTLAIAAGVIALLVLARTGGAPATDAAAPPPGGFALGAAGTARNGFGGVIAPSPTMRSWPGTGAAGNGGPFAFVGAHYGSLWHVPAAANNSSGVGYCVMEDVAGEGVVSLQPDPAAWDTGEMARAAALMSSFGGDRVVPYGIDASGPYDVATGEWREPLLLGGGEYIRRRHVAVNFGVKMFLDDVSPSGAVTGLKLARDTAVVAGSGGEFAALRNGYLMAQRLADIAEVQHAVGGARLELVWADGAAPTQPGTYGLEVRAADAMGKPVGFAPIVGMSEVGIGDARTVAAVARVDRSHDDPDETARWTAAAALGWPTMDMAGSMAADERFALSSNPLAADVTDASGTARFHITVAGGHWQLGFHTQAPTADVSLHAGTGIQGQVTWTGAPQSATVHVAVTPPPPTPAPAPAPAPALVVRSIAISKTLEPDDVQGTRDMSGFEFDVTVAGGAQIGTLVTDGSGRTPSVDVEAGTYTIAEVGRPPWANGLDDGGPITVDVDTDGTAEVLEIPYTNREPTASITTKAVDAADGDQLIEPVDGDATIIDTVRHSGLVPGTEYVATGELVVLLPDGDAGSESTTSSPQVIPTGITASTTFVPSEPDGDVDVAITVPADSPLVGHAVVVYQQLAIASSGRIVATHADANASEQTVRIAASPPVDATTSTTTTTTAASSTSTSSSSSSSSTTTIPDMIPDTSTTSSTAVLAPTTTTAVIPTTGPSAASPPRSPELANTGGVAAASKILAGLAVLLLGAGLLFAARRSDPRRARDVSGS